MSTDLAYSARGEKALKWWEDSEDSDPVKIDNSWSPPKTVDLLRNVHINNVTHIKSPFHHRRYPYEFKTKEYFKYKSENGGKPHEAPKKDEAQASDQKPELNVELNPVTTRDITYRDLFKEKSLRQRIYDGEVFFYEDYLEYNIAKDYCRLFGRPFNIPRQDWGGKNFFFGEKIPDEKLENYTTELLRRESTRKLEENDEDVEGKQSETDTLIMSSEFLDDFKKKELLRGEIPNLFENSSSVVKQRPRKDRWVSFHNLKNYGLMIDSVTKCPLIHVQLQSALQIGWNSMAKGTVIQQSEITTPKKTHDPYYVSREHLDMVNNILVERIKPSEEPLPDITKLFKSKSYGINENCYTIGGGRYRV